MPTTVRRMSSTVRARPIARTVHSIGPWATTPPAALTFAPSTACSTSSSVMPPRGHPLGIELHLELAQVAAEPLDGGDARHREQAVLHLELGEIAQRHQVRGAGLGLERELEDLVQPAGQARDERRIGARRQLPGDLRHALGDELAGAVVVGVAARTRS